METILTVTRSDDENDAYTNRPIIHSSLCSENDKYLKFDSIDSHQWFRPIISNTIHPKTIIMNNNHRVFCRKSLREQLSVKLVDQKFVLIETIYVDVNISQQEIIDCNILRPIFLSTFNNCPINSDQKIILSYNKSCVNCKIGKINQSEIKVGLITEKTIVYFTSSCKTKIINSDLCPTLFKTNIDFSKLKIGGLSKECDTIFRRAFSSRSIPPEIIKSMGIKHIRGILLYGLPGCGKTLLAREISKVLNCAEPKIVNGPEIFGRYVGESEENIRKLFTDAEKDNTDNLHVIICDEFDAICKQRGSTSGGTGVNDNVVNQLLAKIDGPKSLDNVLLICMTNRKDLIDEAILRPGRIEVHIEIKLPDHNGRIEIFNVHTANLKTNKHIADDVNIDQLAEQTKNYTGAEIEGVVKCASQYAICRTVNMKDLNISYDKEKIPIVCMNDFTVAISEVKPMFGNVSDQIIETSKTPFIFWHDDLTLYYKSTLSSMKCLSNGSLYKIAIDGTSNSGKSLFVSHLVKNSNVSCARLITAIDLLHASNKLHHIIHMFDQCHEAAESILIFDGIERIVEHSSYLRTVNNNILQTIMTLLNAKINNTKKMTIIIICRSYDVINELSIVESCDHIISFPDNISDDAINKYFPKESLTDPPTDVTNFFGKAKFS